MIQAFISENSKSSDVVIYTDGSVCRGIKSGWAFSAYTNGKRVKEKCGAVTNTTSSMDMEILAISEALSWVTTTNQSHVVIITDSMSTLTKIQKGCLRTEWISYISRSKLRKITWIFSPGHAGVIGNERADRLAGRAKATGRFNRTVRRSSRWLKNLRRNNRQTHTPWSCFDVRESSAEKEAKGASPAGRGHSTIRCCSRPSANPHCFGHFRGGRSKYGSLPIAMMPVLQPSNQVTNRSHDCVLPSLV